MFAYSWSAGDYEMDGATSGAEGASWEDAAWEDAACRDGSGSLTALFFSDDVADIALAKAVCASCPLVVPCLEGALARREPAGVWGGQLFVEGAVVAFKRKRGRPPKNAVAGAGLAVMPADAHRKSA